MINKATFVYTHSIFLHRAESVHYLSFLKVNSSMICI